MIFIFRCQQGVFDGPTPFKVYLYAMFSVHIFDTFTKAFCKCYCYIISFDVRVGLVLLLDGFFLLLLFSWLGALILFFILFEAHLGYLHLVRTFCSCSCSSCDYCEVE